MAESSKRRPRAPEPQGTLEDLRPLLVGPEQGRIKRLEERLDQHFEEMVAAALPQAAAESHKQGEALALAFEPIVDDCARRVMKKDPGAFAEVIAPALGPAIRKAVRDALRAALQKLNVTLARSLSVESMRWRVEARRTGRSFAEVALLRTLVYRVEQIFLIHRETGLLLEHLTAHDTEAQDPDQIAAMMSALETFTHEAFREDARLERFRVGELAGWVEHGPSALVVAIVRGTAPECYERVLRETVEKTHLEHGKALTSFRGDTAPFATTRDLLADCLREHHELPRRVPRLSPRAAIAALSAIVAIVAALLIYRRWYQHRLFVAYSSALESTPGLVVTASEWRPGHRAFTGLRDPLAPEPAAVLAQRGLDPRHVSMRFAPFVSLDPRMIEARAAQVLGPPPSVSLAYHDGILEERGVAPRAWIERARGAATLLPGITAIDDRQLRAEESVERDRARATAGVLDRTEIYFPSASAELTPDQRAVVADVARRAAELFAAARTAGLAARIEVIGHVDPSGPNAQNEALAQARAERVVSELEARGVPRDRLDRRGGGVRADVPPGERDAWRARSVVLHVALRGAAEE